MRVRNSAQRGFVMLTALIFLMVLTVLAITAVRRATQDERFANSIREQNIAFQAAETALRYCQREFELTGNGDILPRGLTQTVHGVPVNLDPGLDPTGFSPPVLWQTKANWATFAGTLPANTVPNVSAQPQCMIEEWYRPNQNSTYSSGARNAGTNSTGTNQYAYVITARSQGTTNLSVIWLQVVIYLGSGA